MKKNGRKGPMKRLIVGVALLLLVSLVLYRDAIQGVTVRTAGVRSGPMMAYVEERAFTSLPRLYHITMPMQGRIMPIKVEEGDAVTRGQVVARVEEDDWLDATEQVDQIVAAMGSAVKAATAQIKASEARADFTKWVWDANEKTGGVAVSEQDKRRSKWQYLDAVVKTEESTANFYAMDAFYSVTRILQPYVKRTLDRTTVECPVDGVVLKRHVWNEKMMTAGAPLLDIGNLSELEITAEILTEEAVRIQPGDRVEIFGETIGSKPMNGTVRRVEPEAFTKLSSLGVEQQRVNVKIAFDPDEFTAYQTAGRSIGLHYRVRVRIVTDEQDETLFLPRTALFRGPGGTWQTFRIEKGRARLVDLKIGLTNNRFAEVLEGMNPGDTVVDAPESGIADGVRVDTAFADAATPVN